MPQAICVVLRPDNANTQYDTYHYFKDYHKELQTVCANVDSIVINSHNPDILRQFDSPIEIGNLSDIANVADHYLSDGIEITATFDTYITP